MRRRALLTSVAIAVPSALAGCTDLNPLGGDGTGSGTGEIEGPTASLKMEAMNDSELLSKRLIGRIGDSSNAKLFDRILDGGATVKKTRPPLPKNQHLFYDNAVYQLSYEVVERSPATFYAVKVDIAKKPAGEAETIRFSELPAVDRETFAENGVASGETIGIGMRFLYTDAERKRSVLVPESDYSNIVWEDGSRAEWIVDGATDTTLKTYRYTAERITAASEYGRRLRERFGFELSNLSDAERNIIETAIKKNQYLVASDESPSSALVSLTDRFRTHEQVHRLNEDGEEGLSGSYIVRYENTTYWATFTVSRESFPSESSG